MTGVYRFPADFEDGDFRKYAPRFSAENFPKNLKLVDALSSISKNLRRSAHSRLTHGQGDDIIPIPGTKRIKYLEENLDVSKVKLTKDEEQDIRGLVGNAKVHGARCPEAMMGSLFADTPALNT